VIGDNVWVAVRVRLRSGVTIGDNAIIGLKSVVEDDVPAGAIVAGNPGRVVGWVQ
jgi:acetyltransferase-like isoleucine patch superfamily enzyme